MKSPCMAAYPETGMEEDPGFRKRRERLRLLLHKIESLLGETDNALDVVASEAPTRSGIGQIDRLRGQLELTVRDYLDQNTAFLEYLREQASKIQEANRKAAMAEKGPRPARNQAGIKELSDQLMTDLRLERVDNAIKELLDFLADGDFFAANASTGRRRRLRSLQNAIEKALQK